MAGSLAEDEFPGRIEAALGPIAGISLRQDLNP
jgi:hypothetical protein